MRFCVYIHIALEATWRNFIFSSVKFPFFPLSFFTTKTISFKLVLRVGRSPALLRARHWNGKTFILYALEQYSKQSNKLSFYYSIIIAPFVGLRSTLNMGYMGVVCRYMCEPMFGTWVGALATQVVAVCLLMMATMISFLLFSSCSSIFLWSHLRTPFGVH